MATKKAAVKSAHPKKEFKKELITKIAAASDGLKSMIGDEEFQHRVKKAAKMLARGLDDKDFSVNANHQAKKAKPTSSKKGKASNKAHSASVSSN